MLSFSREKKKVALRRARDDCHREITLSNPDPGLLQQIRELAGDSWQGCRPARNSLETVFLRGIQAKLREQGKA